MTRAQRDPLHLNTADLRARIADTVNRVAYGRERVVLTRRGRPLAALVPIEDLETLQRVKHPPTRSRRG